MFFISDLIKIGRFYRYLKYRNKFKSFGKNSDLMNPLRINGYKNITICNKVSIGQQGWLAAVPLTDSPICELVFREGAIIGNFCHIIATGSITIEENASVGNYVYISDNLHTYDNIKTPISRQSITQLNHIVIGEGAVIGDHVSIIGASIGKFSVIGANSVVTKDVPDYCIAIGSPARIIKQYCYENSGNYNLSGNK